jgi:GntR family transcriptional repressor for pyruvate dehydrogenase complex
VTFTKLSEVNRPRHVVDSILSSIQDGSLVAGERLPSEAKLAELTGVGRTSVREALAALRLMGVIETRVGAGSYVRETTDHALVSNGIARAIEQSEEALQLQEARAVFETGMVRLAAARWSPQKTGKFEDVLSRMAKAAESEGYTNYIQLHRNFHLMLAQATDNAVVESTARSFLETMDHEGWQDMERQFYLPNRREILSESVDLHRGIVEALASGDGALASQRVHDHFEHYEHESADQEPEKGSE